MILAPCLDGKLLVIQVATCPACQEAKPFFLVDREGQAVCLRCAP